MVEGNVLLKSGVRGQSGHTGYNGVEAKVKTDVIRHSELHCSLMEAMQLAPALQ